MLTQDQRDTFRKAAASWNACGRADVDIDDFCDDENITETRDTVDNFRSQHGSPQQEKTAFGMINVWDRVQARKGARRGTLLVMDFGDARAAYFDGEI